VNGHKREERIVEGKALVFQWVLPPGDPPPFCAKAGLFKQLHAAQGSASAPRKRNGKRKRTKNYDSASEEDGPSDVESEFTDDDDDDDGGRKLVRTSTLEGTFDVDFIVQGPRSTDGKYKVRWVGYEEWEDTWEPPDHLGADILAEYNESQYLQGGEQPADVDNDSDNDSDSEGDDAPLASALGFHR